MKCTLRKVDGAFGFFLRDDSGHFLGNIEHDGAADRAGVKDGDQIIEVNSVNVEKESHDKVRHISKLLETYSNPIHVNHPNFEAISRFYLLVLGQIKPI